MVARTDSEPMLVPPYESGIIELSLMLSRGQFDSLEERASFNGLSVAQFLRRLVHDSICDETPVIKSR